jgi:hypothetical protein
MRSIVLRRCVVTLFLTLTLLRCQTFDPKKRLTAEEALEHPYLSSYVRTLRVPRCRALNSTVHQKHDPDDEPAALFLDPDSFDFDGTQMQSNAQLPSSHLCN